MLPNIYLAFNKANSNQAVQLSKLIAKLGPNSGAMGYYIPSRDAVFASDVKANLQKSFTRAARVDMDQDYMDYACRINQQFYTAALHAIQHTDRPFVFMEPTSIPMERGWLEKLGREWERNRLPVLGRLIKEQDTEDGTRILRRIHGHAVYSHDIFARLPLLKNLGKYTHSYAIGQMSPMIFDRYLSTEVQRNGANTEIIGYYPGSVEYKGTKFAAKDPDYHSILKALCPEFKVERECVMACGCEDGSLIEHLLGEKESEIENDNPTVEPPKRRRARRHAGRGVKRKGAQ